MRTATKVFLETLPLLLGMLLAYLFWRQTTVLLVVYLLLTFALLYSHKDSAEYGIFAYGVVVGTLIEVVGTRLSGYQSFTKPDIAGIPFWLPVSWGYGFICMKRIGFILKGA